MGRADAGTGTGRGSDAGADGVETEGFGHVSRTRDVAFRYLLLAATLVGILSLAVLLGYVALDAFQPLSADPAWYGAFAALFAVPTLGFVWYLSRRNAAALRTGASAGGILVGGAMVGAGLSVLFIEVVPALLWLAYALGLGVGVALVAAHRRGRPDAGFAERLAFALLALGGSLFAVPHVVVALPVVPAAWLTVLLVPGVPAAAGLGWWVARRYERRRLGVGAGALAFLAAFVGANVGVLAGVGGLAGVLLTLGAVVPAVTYAGVVVRERPDERVGVALPAVALLGLAALRVAEGAAGVAGPQSWVDWGFLTSAHDSAPAAAGLYPALVGSVMLMVVVAALAFPVGVGAAVYLEEYAPDNRLTRLIQINISNLAGVPSVVYGLLGLGIFVRFVGFATGSLLVGGMTLALLILPIVIISAQEAIRSVPDTMRQASYGMGATQWQTVRNVVLPRAVPGILTGTILALGRAIGETAPLIIIGAPAVAPVPGGLFDKVSAMPMQVFAWATVFANPAFYTTALAAGVVVMLVVLLTMNSAAIVLRNRYEREE